MGRSSANRLIYMLGILFVGVSLFVLFMAAESYLRTGVPRRQLLRRFVPLAAPLAIAGGLGLLLLAISMAQLL